MLCEVQSLAALNCSSVAIHISCLCRLHTKRGTSYRTV